jgi:copper homeostasis protein
MARDPYAALEDLIGLGIDRVLTSGQEASILEGLDLIVELVKQAGERIIVMPGGVNERSVKKIIQASGAREVHFVAPGSKESLMAFRNPRCFMGGELRPPEFMLTVTDPQRVREIVDAAG